MGLGPFGTGTGQVSLAAARDKADEVRAILGRGGDATCKAHFGPSLAI
jgi:hypothetical protein